MDAGTQEQLAAFRYGLIAPIASRQTPLRPGELKQMLTEIAAQAYTIPGSHKNQVSIRTLERYLADYRKDGWDALKPKKRPKTNQPGIPAFVLQSAIDLRKARPERSVEQLIYLLENSAIAVPGSIAASTLSRYLRKAGVSRQELLQDVSSPKGHRRFEAEDVHCLWQSDFQHTLYIPDPGDPKKRKKAILFAIIDDYSRLIVHAEFYWDEKLPRLEDSLKKAILRHGVPERFYTDNGAVFSSHHLARICGKLGIHLSHSRPYRPAGRGKIEKFFRFIDTSFKPEAYEQVQSGGITTLEQLNGTLVSWVDGYYHVRKHGGTGQTPRSRAAASTRLVRKVPMTELVEIFLWEETRKVDKTGCVSLFGNSYEVPVEFAGQKTLLRFDPFDLKTVQVWHEGRRLPDAVPLDVRRSVHDRVKSRVPTKDAVQQGSQTLPAPDSGAPAADVSFFQIAEKKRRDAWGDDPLTFTQKLEVPHD